MISAIELDPKVANLARQEPKIFFNTTTDLTSGNLVVVNKTNVAYATGIVLASAFLAYTLVYSLEDESASKKLATSKSETSRIDNLLSGFFSSDSQNSEDGGQKSADKCDCETYCSNKYYYGDPYYDASNTNYDYYQQQQQR